MRLCIHPTYFPNIFNFALFLKYEVIWEVSDNFQKQTYRNRCYIATDTGSHLLSIPIKHTGGTGRQRYKDVEIDNSQTWQRDHWRGIKTAYRASPFFEFYEDDLEPLFSHPFKKLIDLNMETIRLTSEFLKVDVPMESRTTKYEPTFEEGIDGRHLVESKQYYPHSTPKYLQVFGDRHGFLPDLSILDLLFNEGTASKEYLERLIAEIDQF